MQRCLCRFFSYNITKISVSQIYESHSTKYEVSLCTYQQSCLWSLATIQYPFIVSYNGVLACYCDQVGTAMLDQFLAIFKSA